MISDTAITFNCFSTNSTKFVLVLAIILFVVLFKFLKNQLPKDKVSLFALIFVLMGTTYNLFFRLTRGCVEDYFDFFNLFKFNWADVFITGGVFVLALKLIIVENRKEGGDS